MSDPMIKFRDEFIPALEKRLKAVNAAIISMVEGPAGIDLTLEDKHGRTVTYAVNPFTPSWIRVIGA